MPASSSKSPRGWIERLLALLIALIVFAWMGFVWERYTGLTFVLGRGRGLGRISTPAHLQSTLQSAKKTTLICVPLAILCVGIRRRLDP